MEDRETQRILKLGRRSIFVGHC